MESNRHNLTKDQLAAIFSAWNYNISCHPSIRDLERRIAAVSPPASRDPRVSALLQRAEELLSDLAADRLLANDRNQPFLTKKGFVALFDPTMAKELFGDELEDDEIAAMESFFKTFAEEACLRIEEAAICEPDLYTAWWRNINTLLDISKERKMSPIDCLAIAEVEDELVRRLYTKEQYADKMQKTYHKIGDAEMMKGVILEPFLQALALQCDYNEDERAEMRSDLEENFMPQLRTLCEKMAQVFNEWFEERVAHLYGV